MLLSLTPFELSSHRCNAPLPVLHSRISSSIGPRPFLFAWQKRHRKGALDHHWGVDIVAPDGTPVRSVFDGYVSKATKASNGDRFVKVRSRLHNKRFETRYHHLSRVMVHEGQSIKRGEILGIIGDTGASYGVHLHLEMNWLKGKTRADRSIDPLPYLCRYPMPKMDASKCRLEGRSDDGSARFLCPKTAILPWRRNGDPKKRGSKWASPQQP